jgi:hypothetical protein
MLNHFTIGPTATNRYLVVYLTPGCQVPTTVEDCPTQQLALDESVRLNGEQIAREEAIRADARARGLYHIYPDLKGK